MAPTRMHQAPGRRNPHRRRTIGKTSSLTLAGVPLWQIARGPDPESGERFGHARGLIAIGDRADGVVAVGGVARGVFAAGGIALGVVALGGISLSVLAGLGGVSISAMRAIGGVAIAPQARGGCRINGTRGRRLGARM